MSEDPSRPGGGQAPGEPAATGEPPTPTWGRPPDAPPGWGQPQPPATPSAWGPTQPPTQPPGPTWGQPQQPPPPSWGQPQPPSPWGQPGGAWVQPAPAAGGRTAASAVAGVILAVLGALSTIVGLLLLMVGTMADQFASDLAASAIPPGAISGMLYIVGGVIVALGLVQLIAGVGILLSREWGRFSGIVVSILWLLLGLLIVVGGVASPDPDGGSALVTGIVISALYGYCLVVLAVRWRSNPS